MKPSVARLIDGIVATLRDDVIPHVGDPYARGQVIGVIDLLNNYGARLDWDAVQAAASLTAKRRALAEARALADGNAAAEVSDCTAVSGSALIAAAREADREISDQLAAWMAAGKAEAGIARLRRHMHDELREEMKMTKRPMFAEIAKGG